jgi:Zn-dependent protease
MHIVRIPVRVIPTFWLVAALLGWNPDRFDLMAIWMVCMFFSILVHELGHALTAEAFGYETDITLYHFGGFARFNPGYHFPPGRSFLITLAGPSAGFALAALTFVVWHLIYRTEWGRNEFVDEAIGDLLWINIVWGIFNLLPLLPLDGGKLLEATFGLCGVRGATDWALKVSVATGALATIGAFQIGMQGVAIFLALMTVQNVQMLQGPRWYLREKVTGWKPVPRFGWQRQVQFILPMLARCASSTSVRTKAPRVPLAAALGRQCLNSSDAFAITAKSTGEPKTARQWHPAPNQRCP